MAPQTPFSAYRVVNNAASDALVGRPRLKSPCRECVDCQTCRNAEREACPTLQAFNDALASEATLCPSSLEREAVIRLYR